MTSFEVVSKDIDVFICFFMSVWSVSLDVSCQVQARWDQDLHAIEESIRLMLGNRLQEAEDAETG